VTELGGGPIRVLVSGCLLGEEVRYSGAHARVESPVLARWLAEGRVVSFCPEVAGGLGTPRPAAEIRGAGGDAVLDETGSVVTASGQDATESFLRGAQLAVELAAAKGVRLAVLKDGSPSCGSETIYDGSFVGRKTGGRGVTTALLERRGIRVFGERAFEQAARYLVEIETARSAP